MTHLPPLAGNGPEEFHRLLLTRLPDEERREDAESAGPRERSLWIVPVDSSGRYSAASLRPGTYRIELMSQESGGAKLSLKSVRGVAVGVGRRSGWALAGLEPVEPGTFLGETEVRAGETARLDATFR